jgi:phenylpropionate dioxygenase-like ring-hydroxylating dioxygenase large terminal subunit
MISADSGIPGLERTLPSFWYQREDVFALEREHIFFREWMCVGRAEELPGPGDHRVLDVCGQSIILVRNQEGAMRAFYNVCRHRGARLCSPPGAAEPNVGLAARGGVSHGMILCPYHAWTYDLNGQLLRAPHLAAAPGFDAAGVQLYPVLVESWGGFVFLNLSPAQAQPFAETVGGARTRLARYPLAELRVASTIRYEVDANWKLLCENYNECYHCGPVHPELCGIVPSFRESGGGNLDWERGIAHRDGADTFTASGTSRRRSFPGLNEDERLRHKGELLYPNLFVSAAREHVAAFILWPNGPRHTRIDCHFLFEPHEIAQPDFDPADAVDFWHLVNRQDWNICELVQAGIAARPHKVGVFSPMEDWNLDIRRYVSERIGRFVPRE